MARIIETDRGPRARADPAARTAAAHPGGAITWAAAEVAERPGRRVPRGVHASPATQPGGCRGCARRSRCWRSRRSPRGASQLALTWGVETFLVPLGRAHRRHGACRSTGLLLEPDRCRQGDLVVIVAGIAARHPGIHERDARARDRRRRRPGGPRLRLRGALGGSRTHTTPHFECGGFASLPTRAQDSQRPRMVGPSGPAYRPACWSRSAAGWQGRLSRLLT